MRLASCAWVVGCLLALSLPALGAPSVSLTPDKGPEGSAVTVQGSGFESGEEISLQWDDSGPSTSVTANGSGGFSATLSVPSLDNGPHQVVATAASGTGSGRFVVTGKPSPTTTAPTTTTTAPPTTTSTTTTTTPPTTTTLTTTTPDTTAPTPTTTTTPPTTAVPDGPTTTSQPDTTTGSHPPDTTSPATVPGPPDSSTTTSASTEKAETEEEPPPPDSESAPETTTGSGGPNPASDEDDGLRVETFALRPSSGPAGAGMRVEAEFNRAPSTSGVQVMLGGRPLGGSAGAGQRLSIRRTVPDLPPATYEVTLVAADRILARSEFTVIEKVGAASGPFVFLGLVAVALGVGWTAALRPWGPGRSALGAADAMNAWLARRRVNRG